MAKETMGSCGKLAGTDYGPMNLSVENDGPDTVIRFNRTRRLGDSKSGKTKIVASSKGFLHVGEGIRVSLNAIVDE